MNAIHDVRAAERSVPAGLSADDASRARGRLRPLRWLWTAVVVIAVAEFLRFLIANPRWEWGVVAEYLFSPYVLRGALMTIVLSVIAMVLGCVIGVLVSLARFSDYWLTRTVAVAYIGFFRAVPLLVQLIFWYNLSYLLPRLTIGFPGLPEIAGVETNAVVTAFMAAILGLGLNEGAQMAEVFRSGLLAVGRGQADAAKSLGMPPFTTFMRITLPQAVRVIIPPTATNYVSLLKATSLVSVIAMGDLLYSVQLIYNETFQIIPLLMVACCWYFVMVVSLQLLQTHLERKFGRGFDRA